MNHLNSFLLPKLPVSAVIVTHNEAHLLDSCLSSIQFCEEIIVIDLESTDASRKVAEKYSTKLLSHPKSPAVEPIRHWIVSQVKYDWILYIDPDEKIDSSLQQELVTYFPQLAENIGCISVPWQFYFKNHALKGTF